MCVARAKGGAFMQNEAEVKLIKIDERDINSGRVMEMTEQVIYTEDMQIAVPSNYHAYIICEDSVIAWVKPAQHKRLQKILPSEYSGKKISALYVSTRPFTAMSWGIGSLPMVYPFLDNAKVNIGANGTLIPVMRNAYDFFKLFDIEQGMVSLTECTSAITSAFRRCASEVLVELFVEAAQPVFETEFLIGEMNRRINKRYCTGHPVDCISGIVFRTANVLSITVNESDKQAVIEKFGNKKKK